MHNRTSRKVRDAQRMLQDSQNQFAAILMPAKVTSLTCIGLAMIHEQWKCYLWNDPTRYFVLSIVSVFFGIIFNEIIPDESALCTTGICFLFTQVFLWLCWHIHLLPLFGISSTNVILVCHS